MIGKWATSGFGATAVGNCGAPVDGAPVDGAPVDGAVPCAVGPVGRACRAACTCGLGAAPVGITKFGICGASFVGVVVSGRVVEVVRVGAAARARWRRVVGVVAACVRTATLALFAGMWVSRNAMTAHAAITETNHQ